MAQRREQVADGPNISAPCRLRISPVHEGAELDALAKALNANEPDEEEIELDENGEEEDDEAVPSPPSFMFSRPEQAKARRAAMNRDAERRQAMYRQMAGAAEDEDTVPPAPKWMTKKD